MSTQLSTTATRSDQQQKSITFDCNQPWEEEEEEHVNILMQKDDFNRMEEIFLISRKCQTRSCIRAVLPPTSNKTEK